MDVEYRYVLIRLLVGLRFSLVVHHFGKGEKVWFWRKLVVSLTLSHHFVISNEFVHFESLH